MFADNSFCRLSFYSFHITLLFMFRIILRLPCFVVNIDRFSQSLQSVDCACLNLSNGICLGPPRSVQKCTTRVLISTLLGVRGGT